MFPGGQLEACLSIAIHSRTSLVHSPSPGAPAAGIVPRRSAARPDPAALAGTLALATALTTAASAPGSATEPAAPSLAVTHATVIDATGRPPLPDATVLIAGDRITAVGPAAEVAVPPGTRLVDARGKFLIPALWDMHVHLANQAEADLPSALLARLLLAHGVVGARDMGGDWDRIVALRRAIAASEFHAPEILSPGPFLDGPHDPDPIFVSVLGAADAPAAVAKVVGLGVDFLKVQSGLSREAHAALASEANRLGLPFVGHIPEALTALEVVRTGQLSIEHVSPALPGDAGLMRGCSAAEDRLLREIAEWNAYVARPDADREEARRRQREIQSLHLDPWDRGRMATLFREMKERGTRAVPTLIWSRSFRPLAPEDDGRGIPMELFPAAFRERVLAGRRRYLDATPPPVLELNRRIAARSADLVGELQRAGVPILAGTDTTDAFVVPGFSLHQELELLVGAGLSPLAALQAATIAPARFLGRETQQGTVEAGKRADLVVLDANPLEDIRNTRRIFALVAGGSLADRAALDRLLAPGTGAPPKLPAASR